MELISSIEVGMWCIHGLCNAGGPYGLVTKRNSGFAPIMDAGIAQLSDEVAAQTHRGPKETKAHPSIADFRRGRMAEVKVEGSNFPCRPRDLHTHEVGQEVLHR